jgi:ABC-type nickel/cobalt efflux system permease component RcnA
VRWSVGHGGAIVLVGAGLILMGLHLPDAATHWLERLVGAVMIGLGIWTFRGARALHAHPHVHADGAMHEHVHSHEVETVTTTGMPPRPSAWCTASPARARRSRSSRWSASTHRPGDTVPGGLRHRHHRRDGCLRPAGRARGGACRPELGHGWARLLARVTGVFTMVVGVIWLVR